MPPKKNPLNLNALQLKTLALLQHLAVTPGIGISTEEGIRVSQLPRPHGDHFHVGNAVVVTKDASGLTNEAVWVALERKGLIRSGFPNSALMTETGLAYDTGVAAEILHRADH